MSIEINYWFWLVLWAILTTAELVVPGVYLLWVGMAALPAAVIAYGIPDWGWQGPALVFAGFGVANAVMGHYYYALRRRGNAAGPNQKAASLIGQTHVLDEAMNRGKGRIRLNGSIWTVQGPHDLPAGTRIRITAVDGNALCVEQTDA